MPLLHSFQSPVVRLHHSVLFYHLVFVGGLDTGLQPQTGKLLLHPQLCVSLRLKEKSGSTSAGRLGCKPIPARLSPFSPPVPELLQCGCSPWCRPSMVWSDPELGSAVSFSPLRRPPQPNIELKVFATGVLDFLLLLLSVLLFDEHFNSLLPLCSWAPSHAPYFVFLGLVRSRSRSRLFSFRTGEFSARCLTADPLEFARCPSPAHTNTHGRFSPRPPINPFGFTSASSWFEHQISGGLG